MHSRGEGRSAAGHDGILSNTALLPHLIGSRAGIAKQLRKAVPCRPCGLSELRATSLRVLAALFHLTAGGSVLHVLCVWMKQRSRLRKAGPSGQAPEPTGGRGSCGPGLFSPQLWMPPSRLHLSAAETDISCWTGTEGSGVRAPDPHDLAGQGPGVRDTRPTLVPLAHQTPPFQLLLEVVDDRP